MEESACHEMVIFIYRRDFVVCYVYFHFFFFCIFSLSFKYEFHVDADRMIVNTREM